MKRGDESKEFHVVLGTRPHSQLPQGERPIKGSNDTMKHACLVLFALGAVITCAASVTSIAAEEQTKVRCSPGLVKVTPSAAAPVYDGPGGSKIGYLAPGTSYVLVESQRRETRDLWHLLVARGGEYIGWIRSFDGPASWKACPHTLPPINVPLERLYGKQER